MRECRVPETAVVVRLRQAMESRCGGLESAGVEVERLQMGLVIHVNPTTPCRSGVCYRSPDYRPPQPSPLMRRVHDRVEEEPVHSAVPNKMDECDQVAALKGPSPGDAVSAKPVSPRRDISVVNAESKSMKAGDLFVIGIEVDTDLVGRDHGWNLLMCRDECV